MTSHFRRWSVTGLTALALFALTPKATAGENAAALPPAPPSRTMDELVRMSANDLTALYLASPVTAPPQGFAPGKAIKNQARVKQLDRGLADAALRRSRVWQPANVRRGGH